MNIGGTARYIEELVTNIPNSALAFGTVQGSELEDAAVNRIEIYRIPHLGRKISPIKDLVSWWELRKICKRLKPDILHTHTFKAGLIGRLICGKHKRVHTYHGHLFADDSFGTIAKLVIAFIERILAKRTDILISVGIQVGVELRDYGIGRGQEWRVIPPGVNQLPGIDKRRARELLGLKTDEFLIGWMARVTAVKNPYLLLEVAKIMPEASFVLAGGGDLLAEIQLIKPKNITIVGWTDASIFWSAVDCAISTSNNEGMPIALIEAQLSGIPVVATSVGSTAEIIVDGVTGFVTANNPAALAKSLKAIKSDQKLLFDFSKQARLRAKANFSVQNMLEAHEATYESLM
jgi:glycosyltransferase involved in cell wall biosynthesis